MNAMHNVAALGTRFLCVILGIATVASFALAGVNLAGWVRGSSMESWMLLIKFTGAGLLFASGYIMFAIGWPARFADPAFHFINAVLLMLPLTVAVMMLGKHPILPPYVAVTAFLLLVCVKPLLLGRQAR